ncbi:unnamed protein product [Hymenolepis diminuta]|uniref:EGF-like domain-containing protein n=1 Tax=Hymenolepis diminuta TaxID=6216 RepID=A0A3P7A3L8_HYMDI|nr:unnamed protein product [Hymenolepis diminuta]
MCFRPYDAEENEEKQESKENICEIASINATRKDMDQKNPKHTFLRKSTSILDKWPTERCIVEFSFLQNPLPYGNPQWLNPLHRFITWVYDLPVHLIILASIVQSIAGQSLDNSPVINMAIGCTNGWKGELCDECIPYPGCQHGTCNDAPFTCHCLPNWGGAFCDQDLNYCGRHKPCLNGGICKNTNITSQPFQCTCPRGWTGETCEKKLKACDLHPCKRGHCRETTDGGFDCVCEPGWRGELCDQNIDFCEHNLCMNGGKCQDLDGLGFRCDCPRGFEGSVCQLRSPCIDSQCVHAHKCTQLATVSHGGIKHECLCLPGWTGELCDQNIDDCVDKCLNGGTCHDLVGDYYCTCPEGFSGRNCEINHKCASNPCKNDGVCVEVEGGFKCVCPEGVTGDLCEHAKRGCDPNPCENMASCYNLNPHEYYCKCHEGFYGRHCELTRPYCGPEGCSSLLDPCANIGNSLQIPLLPSVTFNAQSPAIPTEYCGEHGICMQDPSSGQYTCVCENGYTGRFCQQVKDNCLEMGHLCRNGAKCVSGEGDNFYCLCEEGFTGTFCEQELHPCDSEPCRNGAYCQPTEGVGDTSFQCRCASGWAGRWCHLPSPRSPCQVSQPCHNGGVCVDDALSPHGFFCQCSNGWTGLFCQTRSPDYESCESGNFCRNGGTCINVAGGFHCICPPGFIGDRCEEDIDECQNNPCQNGGKCKGLVNGFECVCAEGFMGVDCRHNIDECVDHPCAYGARCVDKIGTYECICPEGRSGRHCEEVIAPVTPKPPSCRFNHHIFDHGERWSSYCATCECVNGNIVCKRVRRFYLINCTSNRRALLFLSVQVRVTFIHEFCGYWSCLTANSDADPFACGPGEECRLVSSAPSPPLCITPPCYARAQCVNASLVDVTLPPMAPLGLPPALSGCRPGSARLTNQCARLAVVLARSRLPYGITVEDFCNSVKALPAVEYARTGSSEGGLLGMSCGLAARQPEYGSDLAFIEITLTSTDERIRKAEDGKEFVFVQRFAHNIATAIRENASANVTSNTKNPPSIALMMGAESQDYYWNTILHGVAEINVETVLVKDDEIRKFTTNPLLVPLACSLVVAVGALFTCIICVCAHRKHQELMEKYSIKQPPVITAIPADQSITTPTTITHQYYTPGIVYTTSPTGQQQMTLARVQN